MASQRRIVASRRCAPPVRHIRRVAAIEEQDVASAQPGGAALAQPGHSAEEQAYQLAAAAEAARIDELDETQEELLQWMLFESAEGQEADLDADIDYEELEDGEYADIFEEVRFRHLNPCFHAKCDITTCALHRAGPPRP